MAPKALHSGLQMMNEADKRHVQPALGFNDSPLPQLEQKKGHFQRLANHKKNKTWLTNSPGTERSKNGGKSSTTSHNFMT